MLSLLLRRSRVSFPVVHCLTILSTQLLLTSFATVSSAATLSPADQIRLDSAVSQCSEPGKECPRLQQNSIETIEYLQVGDEDLWSNPDEPGILSEDGLLVTYLHATLDETSPVLTTRFFPLSKVELSPDGEYYMCPKGGEFKFIPDVQLKNLGIDPMILSNVLSEGFQPTSFVCKCFWAPKSLFKELDIDKKKIPRPQIPPDTDIIQFPDSPIPPPSIGDPNPPGIIIDRPTPFFDRPTLNPRYYYNPHTPHHYEKDPTPPALLTPVPVGGKCGLFPWKCAFDAVVDLIKAPTQLPSATEQECVELEVAT